MNYQFDFGKNILSIATEGTLFKKLDHRKSSGYSLSSSFVKNIPFLNKTEASYKRVLINKVKNDKKELQLNILAGYHYFQHGSRASMNYDYWSVDSIENGGVKIISGFKTHSAIIGVDFSVVKHTKTSEDKIIAKHKNTISLNYLLGIDIQLTGVNDYSTHVEKTEIKNTYTFNQNGFKIYYEFERYFAQHMSLYFNFEVLYAPFIDYKPNPKIFVPRGGEIILPLFPSIKLGFKFYKKP